MVCTCDRKNSFDAFSAHGVVNHAEVFSGILDFGLLDDQSSADLFDASVQRHQFLVIVGLHELVPPMHKYNINTVHYIYIITANFKSQFIVNLHLRFNL